MHYVIKRLGFTGSRGFISLFITIVAFAAIALWIGPFTAGAPELRLVALGGDGRFNDSVEIPTGWATTLPAASEATARIPLILAVHNAGIRGGQPDRLWLSVPARFRVTDGRGRPFPFEATIGNPLVRYQIPLEMPVIQPNRLPTVIANLDTLWLEPIVPTIYCTALSDSVPEFVSAPRQDPQLLAQVYVFYSFGGERIRSRQTGLLAIRMDPQLVTREPARIPSPVATQVFRPQAPRPPLDQLAYVGSRNTWCGDPGQPLEIYNVLWETPQGGRFFVIYHGEVPRKYLFDLNRDSVIELEMWDQDGDGMFESRRPARFAIPAFLMPYPKQLADAAAAELALDSAAATPEWFALFHDTSAGPLRFSGAPRRAPAPMAQPAPQPGAPPVARTDTTAVQLPDREWIALFNNTDAGPLRFYKVQMGEPVPPPRPRVRTGPKLLGVPVEEYRRKESGVPADTLRGDTIRLR